MDFAAAGFAGENHLTVREQRTEPAQRGIVKMMQHEIRRENARAIQQTGTGLTPQVRLVPCRARRPSGRLRSEVERVITGREAWHPGAGAPGEFAVARSDFHNGFVAAGMSA